MNGWYCSIWFLLIHNHRHNGNVWRLSWCTNWSQFAHDRPYFTNTQCHGNSRRLDEGEIPDFFIHWDSSPKPIKGSHRTSPQDVQTLRNKHGTWRNVPGSIHSHYFHIIGDKLINPIVGVFIYQLYERIPYFSGGMTIPNIGNLVFRHMSL